MTIKEMHMMRVRQEAAKHSLMKGKKKSLTPLAKEIELRRENMIREIIGDTPALIFQQKKYRITSSKRRW